MTLGSKLYNPMGIIEGQSILGCVKILNYRMGYTYQIYIWIFYVMAQRIR